MYNYMRILRGNLTCLFLIFSGIYTTYHVVIYACSVESVICPTRKSPVWLFQRNEDTPCSLSRSVVWCRIHKQSVCHYQEVMTICLISHRRYLIKLSFLYFSFRPYIYLSQYDNMLVDSIILNNQYKDD